MSLVVVYVQHPQNVTKDLVFLTILNNYLPEANKHCEVNTEPKGK